LKGFGEVGVGNTEFVLDDEILDFLLVLCGWEYDYCVAFVS
jgi:hypothetical protein